MNAADETSLAGKVAVVTGASSGIGEATARDLAGAGVRLVLTARRADRLEALAASLPGEVALLPADMGDPATPQALLDLAVSRFGQADILINNAATILTDPMDSIDLEAVSRMIRINFEATVIASYLFGRAFKAQGTGALINVSSIGAHIVPAAFTVYSALKVGLETFTRSFRQEFRGTGIKVGLIAPGTVDTEIFDGIRKTDEWRETALQPADVASAIRFMLTRPARANIANMLLFADSDPA